MPSLVGSEMCIRDSQINQKIEKYTDLAHKIKPIWQLKAVKIISIIIGALGAISKETKVVLKEIHVLILRLSLIHI